MSFKKYEINILMRLLLLVLTIGAAAFLFLKGLIVYAVVLSIIVIYQTWELLRFITNNNSEIEQFVESIHYRDFSRYFDVKNAPEPTKDLRKGFNEINSTFKLISREKEMQYIYLQKILELVETGIICYELTSGELIWLNESFKKMMGIPYLKTIHSLERRDAELYQDILSLKPKETKITTVKTDKNALKILISVTAFQTDDKIYRLIAFQNINEVVDETEAQAWRRLLSVMTHEIMNSIAPISSLADTLSRQLATLSPRTETSGPKLIPQSALDDLELGVETIQKRSEGLLKFAETYRNLNKITTLNLKKVYVRDLFEHLYQLMSPTLEAKNIELDIILKNPDVQLEADTNLIEQTLINLMVNAVEAIKDVENPRIQLSAFLSPSNKTVIKVADNGVGIPNDVLENIFIPFFSTRKNGSGIGLSLCKQIMMLHKGQIQVQSAEGEGTAFILHF
jgi:two-component system, NtrC family, nitrogen regulation sensor histidine kinase NtrY